MDQVKIGNFISYLRKNKKMTQEDLANKLGVTNKSISRWENGNTMPDISLMQSLCELFNISLKELLRGEYISSEEKDDKEIYSYIKKDRKRTILKCSLIGVALLFVIVFIFLALYFFNNFNKINVYKLYYDSENFLYENATLTTSNDKTIFNVGNFKSINNDLKLKSVSLKSDDRLIMGGSNPFNNSIIYEKNGYNELFTKEVLKNIDNWYLEIEYLDKDNNKQIETLKIENEEIFKNDIFIETHEEEVGSVEGKEIESNVDEIITCLTNKGFIQHKEDTSYYYNEKLHIGFGVGRDIVYMTENNIHAEIRFFSGDNYNIHVCLNEYSNCYTYSNYNKEVSGNAETLKLKSKKELIELAKTFIDKYYEKVGCKVKFAWTN